MARSPEQISRDLESLEAATVKIDQELKELYSQYLEALGKAVKQQLTLAVYHLCTQVYPDAFLQLSVSQREKVQGGIRKIADQGYTQIRQLAQTVTADHRRSEAEDDSEIEDDKDSSETEHDASMGHENWQSSGAEETSVEVNREPAEILHQGTMAAAEAAEVAERLATSLSLLKAAGPRQFSPVSLAKRHVLLERKLRVGLQTISSLANYLLKQAQILPDLPEMVIAAAAEAEAREPGPSTPNLLNVLVEMGSDRTQDDADDEDPDDEAPTVLEDGDPDGQMTHLVAVNLRLADIEFSDTHTALWRSKIQEVLIRLKRLSSHFQKLQQEQARANAEHAWRATWFEE